MAIGLPTPVLNISSTGRNGTELNRTRAFRFSLRSLLLSATSCAIVAFIFTFGVHVGIFIIGAAPASVCAVLAAGKLWKRQKFGRRFSVAIFFALLFLYIASVGPVGAIFERTPARLAAFYQSEKRVPQRVVYRRF